MIVRVWNLRVAVLIIRDAVTVIIRIREIRRAVTIGIQLELRLGLVRGLIWVGHRDRNIELFRGLLVQLGLIREGHRDLTGVLIDRDLVALRRSKAIGDLELGALRSGCVLAILVGEGRRRLCLLAWDDELVLVGRLVKVLVLVGHRDGDVNVVLGAIRVRHNNRNRDLVTRLRILRNGHRDLTGILVDLDDVALRNILTRGELRTIRRRGRVTLLILELRFLNLGFATRLTLAALVFRLVGQVLVRNLRITVILIIDTVAVIIRIRDVRRAITIGIQLELRCSVILRTIRVGHHDRNVKLFRGVLVQLGLIREGHSDLTGILIDLDGIALRSLVIFWDCELRPLRRVDLLFDWVALLIFTSLGECRRRLRLLTRNDELFLVRRRQFIRVIRHQNGPCGDVVTAGNQDNVEVITLLCILWDVEGASLHLGLNALGLVEFASLLDVALLVAPLNLRRQSRQITVELWGHRRSRSGRLVRRVVVSRDRHRGVRHDRVVDVVQGVQILERNTSEVDRQLVLAWNSRSPEVSTIIEALENWSVEARVTVLDYTVLVFDPHEDMVRIQDILAILALLVRAKAQGVFTLIVGFSVDGLEDVLGVVLKHLLGCIC